MTPERRAEADYATLVFHGALVELAVQASEDAIYEWGSVSTTPARIATSIGAFLAKLVNLVGLRRSDARRLTYAYIRYHRALHTGYAVAFPGDPVSPTSLTRLHDEFHSQVEGLVPDLLDDDGAISDANGVVTEPPPRVPDIPIETESLELPDEDDLDDQAEDEVKAQVINSAERSLRLHLDEVQPRESVTPAEVAAEIQEAHDNAGALAASAAQRAVANAGREVEHALAEVDKRSIGYVRISRTGTPCGWCAMLISRGLWRPYSKDSGGGPVDRTSAKGKRRDEETYHTNCQCYSVAVYSEEHYEESPLFDLSRELEDEWDEVTRGLSGKEAIAAFRRHIRQKYRTQEVRITPSPGGAE